jgi:hypothetical protein
MATDSIVGGLFGMTPEMYQQTQNQNALKQASELAQLDPFALAKTGIGYGANRLAGAIGGALGGQDPQLQLISMRNAVMKEINPNDPESIMSGAQRLAPFDPQGANSLATMAREATLKASQVTKNLREGRAAGIGPEGMRAQREAQLQQALRQLQSEGVEQTPEVKNTIQLYKDELSALQRGGQGGLPTIAKLQSYRQSLVDQLGENHPKVKEVDQAIKAETQGKGTVVNVGLSTVDKESNLRKDFTTETKPFTTAINAADKIDRLLRSNTSLGDIIAKKQFAKVAGDNNISNKDVAELANYGDLGQRLAGTLSQFFEGKYTQGQREEALSLVNQLKGDATSQYSTIQNDYVNRAKAENLPNKTSKFIAPDLPIKAQVALPPEGTKLRNKKTNKIEIVRGGKLVPAE